MTRLSSTLLLLAICFSIHSQQDFGIKVSGGFSKFTSNHEGVPPLFTQTFLFAPSGQAGFFYNLHLGKRSVITMEMLFNQMESKQRITYPLTSNYNGIYLGNMEINEHVQISYLAIPIYYGLKIKKFTFNLGIQTSFELSNGYSYKGELIQISGTRTYAGGGESEITIDNYDIGPKAGLNYDFLKRFAAEANCYYGLNDIRSNNAQGGNYWRLLQITLGLRYKFAILNKWDNNGKVESGG